VVSSAEKESGKPAPFGRGPLRVLVSSAEKESGKPAEKPAASVEVAQSPTAAPAVPAPERAAEPAPPPVVGPVAKAMGALEPSGGAKDRRSVAQGAPGLEERIPAQVQRRLAQDAKSQLAPPPAAAPSSGEVAQAPASPAPTQAESFKAKGPVEAAPAREGERRAEPSAEAGKAEQKPATADEAKVEQPAVGAWEVEKKEAPPSVRPSDALAGMIEKKTLLLRVEDVPSASADVKGILARCGAQVNRDYYEKGTLEGAGNRIRAKVPGSRYQALLTELRNKKYVATEVAKPPVKAAKAAPPAKNLSIQNSVIDLTINFQASVAPPAAAAKVRPGEAGK